MIIFDGEFRCRENETETPRDYDSDFHGKWRQVKMRGREFDSEHSLQTDCGKTDDWCGSAQYIDRDEIFKCFSAHQVDV